jgi:hypothetical protein
LILFYEITSMETQTKYKDQSSKGIDQKLQIRC